MRSKLLATKCANFEPLKSGIYNWYEIGFKANSSWTLFAMVQGWKAATEFLSVQDEDWMRELEQKLKAIQTEAEIKKDAAEQKSYKDLVASAANICQELAGLTKLKAFQTGAFDAYAKLIDVDSQRSCVTGFLLEIKKRSKLVDERTAREQCSLINERKKIENKMLKDSLYSEIK